MRHPRVWFAAAPPGGPRMNPAGYYGPALVRAPWNAKAGKAAGAPTGAVFFFLPRLLGAPTPSLGKGKRDGLSRARTKSGTGIALAMPSFESESDMQAAEHSSFSVRPRASGDPEFREAGVSGPGSPPTRGRADGGPDVSAWWLPHQVHLEIPASHHRFARLLCQPHRARGVDTDQAAA